ncbi:hypothetical protein BC835DRAFT_1259572, partial [Cytidiella melzeri]
AMLPHLSQQLRELILSWAIVDKLPISDIVDLAGCSKATVYKFFLIILGVWRGWSPFVHPRSCNRAPHTDNLNFILSLVEANPALYLDKIQTHLLDTQDV